MAKAPTSYIATAGAARTRTADSLTFPLATRPQAMTFYVRFIECGSITCADNTKLLVIGSTGVGTFQVDVDVDPYVHYRIGAGNAATPVTAAFSSTKTPSVGDMVEIVGQWRENGSVAGAISINGATPSTTAASTALARTPSFSVPTVSLNHYAATLEGVTAVRDVLIVRGVHSLAAMRVRMGLTP